MLVQTDRETTCMKEKEIVPQRWLDKTDTAATDNNKSIMLWVKNTVYETVLLAKNVFQRVSILSPSPKETIITKQKAVSNSFKFWF